jgi:hypothetical protein
MAFNPLWEVVELNNVMKSDYRRSERTNRTAVSDGGSDTVKRTAFWAPERTASSGRPEADGRHRTAAVKKKIGLEEESFLHYVF